MVAVRAVSVMTWRCWGRILAGDASAEKVHKLGAGAPDACSTTKQGIGLAS